MRTKAGGLCVIVLALSGGVTWATDVTINSPRDNGGADYVVGSSSDGNTLTISGAGSLVNVANGYIGQYGNSNSVLLTDPSSTWSSGGAKYRLCGGR